VPSTWYLGEGDGNCAGQVNPVSYLITGQGQDALLTCSWSGSGYTLSDPPQESWIATTIDESSGGPPQYVVVTGPASSFSWANGGPVATFYDQNGNVKCDENGNCSVNAAVISQDGSTVLFYAPGWLYQCGIDGAYTLIAYGYNGGPEVTSTSISVINNEDLPGCSGNNGSGGG
jgi:hypothetical protein